jgi:LysM repeat protein
VYKPLSCCVALVALLAACIPSPASGTATPPSSTLSAPTSQPPVMLTPKMATATAQPSPLVTLTKTRYTVRPGDTLLGLAKQYRVSMAAIQLANSLYEADLIRAGQVLEIPTTPRWEGEETYWIVHLVRRGETLNGIAQTFGVTMRDLVRINAIADPGQIAPGQPIVIPLDSLQVTASPTPSPTPATLRTRVPLPANPSPRPATRTALPTLVPATISPDMASWPGAVVALINQKRAAHGLPPYSVAPELMRSAQAHADDCAARGWCSHVGSDGADVKTREIRAGYTPKAWGENWMQAFDPVKAVEWWYNETPPNDPHRRNVLHTIYHEIGVGVAPGENGYYFIADLGSR